MKDFEVLKVALSNKEDGAKAIFKTYGPLFRYIARPILESPEDLEELVQDVVLKAINNIENFDSSKSKLTTWLSTIARNEALNRARKQSNDENIDNPALNLVSKGGNPEEELVKRELKELIQKAIGELPSEDRQIFYRKYYYMQSNAQIARELGRTERSIEGKLYRIRNTIKEKVGGAYND